MDTGYLKWLKKKHLGVEFEIHSKDTSSTISDLGRETVPETEVIVVS